jgi:hypothetical protein
MIETSSVDAVQEGEEIDLSSLRPYQHYTDEQLDEAYDQAVQFRDWWTCDDINKEWAIRTGTEWVGTCEW